MIPPNASWDLLRTLRGSHGSASERDESAYPAACCDATIA